MTTPSEAERVRSFKLRRGRMSARKLDALDRIGPRFSLVAPDDEPLDLIAVFGRRAPVLLDVGFGTGGATVDWAVQHPAWDVVAVDVHTTGVARLLVDLEDRGLTNVRLGETDVWNVLDRLPDRSLSAVRVLFPDPWPKRRHHGRRLVQPPFIGRIADLLADHGWLHVATDWDDYADVVREGIDADPRFAIDRDPADRVLERPITPYEQRGRDAARTITDIVARRTSRSETPRNPAG